MAPPNFPPPSCVCAMEGEVSTSTFSAADSTSATVAATSESVVVTGGGTDAWTSAPGEWKSEGILPSKVGRDHPMTCKCLITMVTRKVPDWGSDKTLPDGLFIADKWSIIFPPQSQVVSKKKLAVKKMSSSHGRFNLIISHTIHGTGIFTYIYHKNQPFM